MSRGGGGGRRERTGSVGDGEAPGTRETGGARWDEVPRRRVEATRPRRSKPPRRGVAGRGRAAKAREGGAAALSRRRRPSEGGRRERVQIRADGNEAGGIPCRRRPLRETLAVGVFFRGAGGESVEQGRGDRGGRRGRGGECGGGGEGIIAVAGARKYRHPSAA